MTIIAQESALFMALLPYATFGVFVAVAWFLIDFFGTRRSRASERLEELLASQTRQAGKAATERKRDAMSKILEKASPALGTPFTPKSEKELGKTRTKLTAAGFRSPHAMKTFYTVKGAALILAVLFGTGNLGIFGLGGKSLLVTVTVAGVLFYAPDVILSLMASSRRTKIFLGLPDALDLMVVCVEAGLGLDQAMRKVSEEMVKSHPVIAEEFAVSNFQLQMGRPRGEVLHELGARTDEPDLRALASVLIQADKFGASIAQALRVQSDGMRVKRRQIAEEKAAKTAVQLLFPLILFIFPGIFVVLVGPAGISMMKNFHHISGGG